MSARLSAGLLCCALAACQLRSDASDLGVAVVWLTAAGLDSESLDALSVTPKSSVRRAVRVPFGIRMELAAEVPVDISAPGACPLHLVPARDATEIRLEPRVRLLGPGADVGYDASFEVSLQVRCSSVAAGSVIWESSGSPLFERTILDGGYRFRARTDAEPARLGAARPGELLAISPAERAETRLVARWTGPDGATAQSSMRITAAPRSRGLPNIAIGERALLGGRGYRVLRRPPLAVADPMPWGKVTSLVPDAEGIWEVAATDGALLRLFASRYDSVPLDCGRADCHAQETHAAAASPMTSTFRRLLAKPGSTAELECTFGCHTTGEPGAADGGFSHAFSELGLSHGELPSWDSLPRNLRRTGGVGCLACHGPGQLPQPSARSGILRTEVCAYCHDAPPRYTHVQALRSGAMATSDNSPSTRRSAACARCHTTWGFLDAIKPERMGARMPPDQATGMGITCAACHAVHDDTAAMPGLLRRVNVAAPYQDLPESAVERSGACLYCHSPTDGVGPSSAAIWAGIGALDPESQEPLTGPAPHAAVPGGCVGCHVQAPDAGPRGQSHTFRADSSSCRRCHGDRSASPGLVARAERLLAQVLTGPQSGIPVHAQTRRPAGPRERALSLVRFVLEDRGAATHNPRYAEALLERAESVLFSESPR